MNKRIIALLMAAVMAFSVGTTAAASKVTDAKNKQANAQNSLNEINKSISAIEKKRKEVQAQISNLNAELVDSLLTLEVLQSDIENKKAEIEEAQAEYERLKALEEEQYAAMKSRIKYMYEAGEEDFLSVLLQAESISDLLNRADFVREISEYDDKKLTQYQETKDSVAEQKAVLEEEEEELEEIQQSEREHKEALDRQIAKAKSKQAGFETELASAKQKAKEYKDTIQKQTAIIKKLEDEERKKAQTAAGKKPSGSSDNKGNSSGGNQLTNSSGGSSSGTSASGSGLGLEIAQYALQFVGNPYVFGGTSLTNGADCSGFTMSVHKHFGINIPRSSAAQAGGGQSVSLGALQAGDIIYYGGHVAIYIGGGKVVHASTARTGIKISSYTYRTPLCARRYW